VPAVPLASALVVIESAGATTVIENWCDCCWLELSLTVAVKTDVPGAVGVPVMLPAAEIPKPAGSVPAAIVQLYGATPPLAARLVLYAEPTVPLGRLLEPMTNVVAAMWMLKLRLTFCAAASVAVTVKLKSPTTVGVPEIVPFAAIDNPVGNVPEVSATVTAPKPPDVST
jgi:hypothetical protein